MVGSRRISPVLLILALAGAPAHAGLIIDPVFDASITGQANAAGIEGTIDSAIATFENTYSNNISASIEFYAMSGGLGESQVGFVYGIPYQAYYDALVATNANPAAIAGLTLDGGNSTLNPVNGTGTIDIKSANARAVGFSDASPLCNVIGSEGNGTASNLSCSDVPGGSGAVDGLIGLNTATTYPPNPNNGSNYGLLAVTEHELDEILGLGSALPNCQSPSCPSSSASEPDPEDLFRYTAPGKFASLSPGCSNPTPAYFSYSGSLDLANFNTACNGADWGDWGGNATAQVQDAFGSPGAQPSYGPNEIAAMSAIGYTVALPEPSTPVLLISSLGVFALAVKRRPRTAA